MPTLKMLYANYMQTLTRQDWGLTTERSLRIQVRLDLYKIITGINNAPLLIFHIQGSLTLIM